MVKYKITEKNFQSLTEKSHALREKCPYSELFWSVFSHIQFILILGFDIGINVTFDKVI